MPERRRSWWGWGWADEALTGDSAAKLATAVAAALGAEVEPRPAPDLGDLDLAPPRLTPPAGLADICSSDVYDRSGHTYGKSFRDVVRGFHADLPHPPDLVAFPRDEADVVDLLQWCTDTNAAVVPYGGGSSVVGGVDGGGDWATDFDGVVSVDLTRLDRVLDIDRASRAARIQAGALGPVLEEQLRPHDLTLRHYPQSFQFSTLGGWLATRSGGHYATNWTHIDDFVESMRVVTPSGISESRRLPGSGAGPSPDRMFLGSEGTLGIITEAWMRLQDRPTFRASAAVRFSSLAAGVAAARAVAQAGLFPTNCRLLDAGEARASAGVDDGSAVLVLGFESADHPLDAWIGRAVECCADHGGETPEGIKVSAKPDEQREGTADAWRSAFLRAPYGRDAMVALGCVAETFETAVTWSGFDALHQGVTGAVERALKEVCGGGRITCRFTHVHPDGPAPYFTVLAPSRHGSQLAQWAEVKTAAADAILANGGTITHHHAVGRDHRPWYDRQRPVPFALALSAAKHALDPAGMLNPGVLIG
ncbi:MAG: linked oxidase domain protein [Acidimicrobiales bacterium]|nr:linked oxidase domain protein [Acidimicrobiales bacterium]